MLPGNGFTTALPLHPSRLEAIQAGPLNKKGEHNRVLPTYLFWVLSPFTLLSTTSHRQKVVLVRFEGFVEVKTQCRSKGGRQVWLARKSCAGRWFISPGCFLHKLGLNNQYRFDWGVQKNICLLKGHKPRALDLTSFTKRTGLQDAFAESKDNLTIEACKLRFRRGPNLWSGWRCSGSLDCSKSFAHFASTLMFMAYHFCFSVSKGDPQWKRALAVWCTKWCNTYCFVSNFCGPLDSCDVLQVHDAADVADPSMKVWWDLLRASDDTWKRRHVLSKTIKLSPD